MTNPFIQQLSEKVQQRETANRLVRVVFNADLRAGHDGLTLLAKGLKLNPANLGVGEFIVFINRKKCALKLFAAGNTVAHFKMPGQQQINMKVIGLIPRFFNGKELQYSDALSEVIRKEIRQ
jgi:hypothetical protein